MSDSESRARKPLWSLWLDDLIDDDVLTQAGAIAYSATLSLAPLLLLIVTAVASIDPHRQQDLVNAFSGLVGRDGGPWSGSSSAMHAPGRIGDS